MRKTPLGHTVMQMPYITHRQVEFRDTDAAGIMHFLDLLHIHGRG